MPLVKSFAEIANPRVEKNFPTGHKTWMSRFIDVPKETSQDGPVAFLLENSKGRVLRTHFHEVDQFQVAYSGGGRLGMHGVQFGAVHFARGFTPYGPIRASEEEGIGFLTLRAHRDPGGAQKIPERLERLNSVPNRRPWQITSMPDIKLVPGETGVAIKAIDGLKDENGLAGYSVALKPGATAFAPDSSRGDGQYIIVLRGSIVDKAEEKKSLTIIWVGKDDGPFQLQAGAEGLLALVLTFPIPGGGAPKRRSANDSGADLKAYQCVLCAYIYDEAEGEPMAGVAPGTRWVDIPANFKCPDCEGTKADFQMIEI